jgi:hypothetical protein
LQDDKWRIKKKGIHKKKKKIEIVKQIHCQANLQETDHRSCKVKYKNSPITLTIESRDSIGSFVLPETH